MKQTSILQTVFLIAVLRVTYPMLLHLPQTSLQILSHTSRTPRHPCEIQEHKHGKRKKKRKGHQRLLQIKSKQNYDTMQRMCVYILYMYITYTHTPNNKKKRPKVQHKKKKQAKRVPTPPEHAHSNRTDSILVANGAYLLVASGASSLSQPDCNCLDEDSEPSLLSCMGRRPHPRDQSLPHLGAATLHEQMRRP